MSARTWFTNEHRTQYEFISTRVAHFCRHLWILSLVVALAAGLVLLGVVLLPVAAQDPAGAAEWTWLPLGSNQPQDSDPSVTVQASTNRAVDLHVSVPGILARGVPDGVGALIQLEGDGFDQAGQPGAPDLPVLRRSLEIPAGAQPTLQVLDGDFVDVDLASAGLAGLIQPEQASQSRCGPGADPLPGDTSLYSADAFYPASPVGVEEQFTVRGRHGLTVVLRPLAYNPVRGILRIYTSLDVRVSFNAPVNAQTSANTTLGELAVFSPLLERTFLNATPRIADTSLDSAAPRYLIVSADAFAGGLDGLVALKQSQGFQVTLKKLSETGTSAAQIKAAIAAQYQGADPPDYLLLVGDSDTLPAWPSQSGDGFTTDLYYATMDGASDYHADILTGRLPVRSADQLQAVIEKLLAYQDASGSEAWVNKAAFLASDDQAYYSVAESAHDYLIDTYFQAAGYSGTFPDDPQPGGDRLYAQTYRAGSAQVLDALNDGRSLVIYMGHGSSSAWTGPSLTQADVRGLSGTPVALVASFACQTASFGVAESLADTWVIQAGTGALDYLGASSNSYWNEDAVLEKAMGEAFFGSSQVTGVVYQSGLSVLDAWSASPAMRRYYHEIYQLFGDPSLEVLTGPKPSDFRLAVQPGRLAVCTGSSASTDVQLSIFSGSPEEVTLAVQGLPAGLTAGFTLNPVSLPGTSGLSLSAGQSTPAGSYLLQINASNHASSHQAGLDLVVNDELPAQAVPLQPANGSSAVELQPAFAWGPATQAVTYSLQVATDAGFSDLVVEEKDIDGTDFSLSADLEPGREYFWRVQAQNACGQGPVSLPARFITRPRAGECQPGTTLVQVYGQDFEGAAAGWTAGGSPDPWGLSDEVGHKSGQAFYTPALHGPGLADLAGPQIQLPQGVVAPFLAFWTRYEFDAASGTCVNGGYLEASDDNGQTWQKISQDELLVSPYDGTLSSAFDNPLGGEQAWCRSSDWTRVVVDLGAYAGQAMRLRFRQGLISAANDWGWAVDDLQVAYCSPAGDRYRVDLAAPETSRVAKPGEQAVFNLAVTNTGQEATTSQLAVEPAVWEVAVTPGQVVLGPGESAAVAVSVHLPADALPGQITTIRLVVQSLDDPIAWDTAALVVEVHRYGIGLAADRFSARAKPAETVEFALRVQNSGNAPETFDLSAVSQSGWPVDLAGSLDLQPGEEREVVLTITVPTNTPGGRRDDVTLRVFPHGADEAGQSLTFTVLVAEGKIYLPVVER